VAADLKKTLRNKLLALALACVLIAFAVAVVRYYFYILDAYYYTAEFHVLFMKNNIGAAKIDLLKEYFSSFSSPVAAFPSLLLAHMVQGFLLPLSKPVLVGVAEAGLGVWMVIGLTFPAVFLVGLLSYGLGFFFLGDIVPWVQRLRGNENYESPSSIGLILGAVLAVPWAPVVPVTVLMALCRLPFKRTLWLLAASLAVRIFLSTAFAMHLA